MKDEIKQLAELFGDTPAVVLTGAGVSTDSGIPDYRGAGTPPRTPMSIEQFMHDEAYRRRFWAGASIGARRIAHIEPNSGHLALAELERSGRITGVITQNVDDLHNQAGSRTVIELHGNGNRIRCVDCGRQWDRATVLTWFDRLNPGFVEQHADAEAAPDGDARVTASSDVTVPICPVCSGTLRPNVVYFGELVPTPVFAAAERLVEQASLLLVTGTSLAVNTGVRLVHRAERLGLPIAVINRGPTDIDHRPSIALRIEGGTSEVLTSLTAALSPAHDG